MKNTTKITIEVPEGNVRDELIASLAECGFEAFEEKESELDAFINEALFDLTAVANIFFRYDVKYQKTIVKDQNWNALWESNFEPVVVDSFCAIRAFFHKPFTHVEHEIVITPKMSFGTGHHATTYMMLSEMRRLEFSHKQVADFGTGTGVLAILAEKLGSNYILALDNDDWSIENSKENIANNNCSKIEVKKTEGFFVKQKFDIILANINKNIILKNSEDLSSGLNQKGELLLSGLLVADKEDVVTVFKQQGFEVISVAEKNGWICVRLSVKSVG